MSELCDKYGHDYHTVFICSICGKRIDRLIFNKNENKHNATTGTGN